MCTLFILTFSRVIKNRDQLFWNILDFPFMSQLIYSKETPTTIVFLLLFKN